MRARSCPCPNGGAGSLEPRQDLVPTGTPFRIGVEEIHREQLEVLRHALHVGRRRRRRSLRLAEEDGWRGAFEGETCRQRLVEHDTDRVPIGGGRRACERRLLRRHVGRRAGHGGLDAVPAAIGEIRRHAEVEQHHATAPGHDHVGRLHVTMELARRVDGHQPHRELAERITEASNVTDGEAPCDRLRARARWREATRRRLERVEERCARGHRHLLAGCVLSGGSRRRPTSRKSGSLSERIGDRARSGGIRHGRGGGARRPRGRGPVRGLRSRSWNDPRRCRSSSRPRPAGPRDL